MKNMEDRIIAGLIGGGIKAFKIYGQSLSADQFTSPGCRKLFDRMKRYTDRGAEYDMVSLANEFPGDDDITPEYLLSLSEIECCHYSLPASLQTLQDFRFRTHTFNMIQQYSDITAGELAEKLQGEIWKYQGGLPNGWNREEAFKRMLNSIEYDMEHGVEFTTGLTDLDKMIGGFYRKEVTFIGARPSTGKSAMAVNIAMHLIKQNKSVLYIDLESGDEPMMERFVCLHTGIPVVNIRRRMLSSMQLNKIITASNEISKLPITINDQSRPTTGIIYNQALNLKSDIIIVDYINQMVKNSAEEVGQLGDIMLGLNTLSKELNIPVIALGQLNRKLEDRSDKRPQMSDIRGSGKIEEYATNIHLLHWPFKYDDKAQPNELTVFVHKQKHGPVGPVNLYWDAPHLKFDNLERGGQNGRFIKAN